MRRRHQGGGQDGRSSWLPRARVAPKEQQVHQVRSIRDPWGKPVWFDFIQPGNRLVRLDLLWRDERPLTVTEYVADLRDQGYCVTVEEEEKAA